MNKSRIAYLFHRYFDNTATVLEKQELMTLIDSGDHSEDVKLLMQEAWETFSPEHAVFSKETSDTMLQKVFNDANRKAPAGRILYGWWKYAAAILIVAGTALWLLDSPPASQTANQLPRTIQKGDDLLPGSNKAVLTLANGSKVVLDDAKNGKVFSQGDADVIKSGDGQLNYRLSATKGVQQTVLYNTLSIPRGGQYKVVLPDGTQVWLNAASSLKYPTSFSQKERLVELEGEAYFEVAKNPNQPFRVQARGTVVTVLGTHFNINAYPDEAYVKSTLLEGSVKVDNGISQKQLIPGEQSLSGNSAPIQILKANTDAVLAWTKGYFYFERSSLADVMRQLSRWYDVDIRYEGKMPARVFGGEISRNANATEVLKILELSKVHFRIEGRSIIVLP